MILQQEGIILRMLDYSDTSKIITIYTPNMGKIALLVRGANRAKSKFMTSCQLMNKANFIFNKGKGMGILSQVDVSDYFKNIKVDILQSTYSQYMLELVDRTFDNEDLPSSGAYTLLNIALTAVDNGQNAQAYCLMMAIKLLNINGTTIRLGHCCYCGNSDESQLTAYDFKENGTVCRKCQLLYKHTLPLSPKALYMIRRLFYIPITQLNDLSISDYVCQQIWLFVDILYQDNLGIYMKSREVIKQMERLSKDLL